MNLADIPRVSRYTFRYHLWFELLNSVFAGVFGLVSVVARKGLGASDLEIQILCTAGPGFQLLASMWAAFMEGRSKRPFIVAAALLGRGALLFSAIVSGSAWFIALCCVVSLADPIFIPAQQAIFQANYDPAWRGRLHGRITFWTRLVLMASSLGAAYVLDQDPELYRLIFPASAVAGILAFLHFAWMRVRRREVSPSVPIGAWKRVRQILRDHPDFDAFERNFYIYGTAFHMLVPVNVFLLVDHLNLSYSHNALATTLVFGLIFAALSPLAGQLLDRWRAVRTSALSFILLGFYPLLLLGAWWFRSLELVYAAFAWFGVAMAGVNTAWNLGAMQFSGRDDASIFMGIHVSAVGVRGLCAPTIGIALTALAGLGTTYLAASILFFLSGLMMIRLGRKMRTANQLT